MYKEQRTVNMLLSSKIYLNKSKTQANKSKYFKKYAQVKTDRDAGTQRLIKATKLF